MNKFFILSLIKILFISTSYGIINPPENLKINYNIDPLGIDNPLPGFSWETGDISRGAKQSAYRIIVSSSLENLEQDDGDVWDTEKVTSKETIQIPYGGISLESTTRYYWKVKTWNEDDISSEYSDPASFETGLINPKDWKGIWITDNRPAPNEPEEFYDLIPVPLFRKGFDLNGKIDKARLYISGLGYYEAFLNGDKVGDHWLDPGWTQYAETVYYEVYDVTNYLHRGNNAIGVMLGNGWYNPLPMRLFGRWNLREILTIGQPKVIAQLKIEYEDGTHDLITTDRSWKTTKGPIVKNNVYLGEWYDARMEKPGWHSTGYDDREWNEVRRADAPAGDLKWQFIPAIKHTRTVYPVGMDSPEEGMYVMDMGQNFAGVIRFKVSAPEGTEIRFRYAELLYDDGKLDFRTTAATQIKEGGIDGGSGAPATAWQEDRYFCKGEGVEVFEPKFTFHGFRYVEITGLPYKPSLNDIEGVRLNADLPDNASFECSNPLFNKIQEVTEWTMLSNVFSIESDCPAREKFAYGGDIVTVGEAYIYNYDMSNFYAKTVRDFERDQRSNGGMPECAPDIGINARGLTENTGPVGWTLAHPFLLKQLYKYYGNHQLLEEQYQPLKDLVDFYREHTPDHIIMDGIGDHNSVDKRPRPVSSTAFYYHHAKILSEMAGVLDKSTDTQLYTALAGDIKEAFIEKFVNKKTGEVYTHTQADQVFALYYDLLPDDLKRKALEVLKDEIYLKYDGHLSTGIFATKMMLEYLSEQNLNDINYTMMNQKEYPGYGYMIDNGATTLWENWDFAKHDSKNHPMFGSVSEWFYRSVLGIQQTDQSVAFSEIVIKPAVVEGLTYAKGHYQSIRGRIGSDWWKLGDDLFMNVEIPANTTALIYFPVTNNPRPQISERSNLLVQQGNPTDELPGEFSFIQSTRDHIIFRVGAGKYNFEIRR